MSELTVFNGSYDLGGKGKQERQDEAKKNLQVLENQQKQLETGIYICVCTFHFL